MDGACRTNETSEKNIQNFYLNLKGVLSSEFYKLVGS
jgi:hypothetical protein